MSAISSIPSFQLSSSSSIKTTDATTSSDSSAVARRTDSPQKFKDCNSIPKDEQSPAGGLGEILTMLKKVVELVSSVLKLFDNTFGRNSEVSSGTQKAQSLNESATRTTKEDGASLQSTGEFLWKPKSDKDGKLAILLPSALEGAVQSVSVQTPSGDTIQGQYAGVGNGSREHFRFNKSGDEFPDGSLVKIQMKDGSERTVSIKDTSARLQK